MPSTGLDITVVSQEKLMEGTRLFSHSRSGMREVGIPAIKLSPLHRCSICCGRWDADEGKWQTWNLEKKMNWTGRTRVRNEEKICRISQLTLSVKMEDLEFLGGI